MAEDSTEVAQDLFDEMLQLLGKVQGPDAPSRRLSLTIEPIVASLKRDLKISPDGRLDAKAWAALSDEAKAPLQDRLSGLVDVLRKSAGGDPEGPQDSQSVMYKEFASNGWVWSLLVGAILFTLFTIWGVFRYWDGATAINLDVKPPEGPPESHVLRMIIIMGALGGALHWTSSFAKYVGNGQLLRRWIPYYLLVPLEGAALAPVIYLLLRVGVLGAPGASGGGTGSLNLISLYGFAALTGLFSKQAIEMLYEVFKTIFTKIKAKDDLEASTSHAAGGGGARKAS